MQTLQAEVKREVSFFKLTVESKLIRKTKLGETSETWDTGISVQVF